MNFFSVDVYRSTGQFTTGEMVGRARFVSPAFYCSHSCCCRSVRAILELSLCFLQVTYIDRDSQQFVRFDILQDKFWSCKLRYCTNSCCVFDFAYSLRLLAIENGV